MINFYTNILSIIESFDLLFCSISILQDDEDDSDDSELSDFDIDETTLETYLTPIDDEDADNPVDEYIAFQQVITRMS